MNEFCQKLVDNIRDLAEKFPDKTSECVYFNNDGTPSCIVGHALSSLGIHAIPEWANTLTFLHLTNDGVLDEVDYTEDEGYVKWVECVQANQDLRETWSKAVSYADELFPETK